MRWLPLLIVLASLRADARPARLDHDFYKPEPPCPRIASWTKFARCKLKNTKFELVHDLPAAKLVSYEINYARGTRRLELYLLANGAWLKSSFYAEVILANSELLGFQALTGNAYRIDVGYATSTSVTLDQVTTRPALLRRQYTYVCNATSNCRTVQTACDVLVHGKAVASFRFEPSWNGSELKLTGIAQNTNRYCPAPPGLQPPEEAP
jgi:hypothetical protein